MRDISRSIEIEPKRLKYRWRAEICGKMGMQEEQRRDVIFMENMKE